jgi:phage-related protein
LKIDGSLNFDTKIDTEGFEGGVEGLKDIMKKLASSIDELSNSIKNAFNGVNTAQIETAVDNTKESLDNADDSARRMEESMRNMDAAIARMNGEDVDVIPDGEVSAAEFLEEALEDIAVAAQRIDDIVIDDIIPDDTPVDIEQADQKASEFKSTLNYIKQTVRDLPAIFGQVGTNIKNAFDGATNSARGAGNAIKIALNPQTDGSNQKIKNMVDEVDRYKDRIQSLESQGYYFGDKEYDDTYRKLSQLNNELNAYKRSLSGTDGEQKKVASSVKKVGKNADSAKKSMGGFGKTLQLLKMSLIFSVAFQALAGATNAIKEGFQNLAQYSQNTNKNLSALQTSLLTLKNSFATAFDPILTAITPALQTLINYLSQAITTAGQFFAVFFNGATTFTKAKDAQVDYAKSLAKTADEANKSLSPIDKLNTVSDTGSGSGTAGTPSPSQMFEEVPIDSKVTEFVKNLKTQLEPLIDAFDRFKVAVAPFANNVGQGLKWLYDNVLVPLASWTATELLPTFLDTLGASFRVLNALLEVFKPYALWLWDNFLQPIAAWTGGMIIDGLKLLADGLNALADWITNNQETVAKAALLIGSFFAAFKIAQLIMLIAPLLTTLGAFITSGGLISTILAGISTVIGALLSPVALITALLGLLIYSFIDLYSSSESFRESIAELGRTWLDALQPLAEFVGMVLADAWNKILKPIIEFFLKTLLPQLIGTFKNLWEKVLIPLANFIGTVLKPVFKILADLLTMIWKNVVLPLANAIGTVLKEAWNGIYEILNKTVIPIMGGVINVLQELWKKVINPIINVLWDNLKPAFETVFDGIKTVINSLKTVLSGIIKFITGVFTGNWKKAWEGIKDIFKGIFEGLGGIAKSAINLVIDIINGLIGAVVSGINAVIEMANGLSFKAPEFLGGKTYGVNITKITAPKIPKLATGTVVPANYGEFLSILGDNTRETEVVSPLSTIQEAVGNELDRRGGSTGGDIVVNVYLSGKQIHTEIVKQDKEYRNQYGKSAFAY